MCTHSGEGDINAVTVTEGQVKNTRNVNCVFAPGETIRPLGPGTRLTDVAVTCVIGDHGFTVAVETG